MKNQMLDVSKKQIKGRQITDISKIVERIVMFSY